MSVYLWTTVCVLHEPFYTYFVFIFNMHFYNKLQTKIFYLQKIVAFYLLTQTNISQNFVSFKGKGGGGVKDKSIMRIYFSDVQHHSTKAVWSNEDAIFHLSNKHCRALPYAYAIPFHRHLIIYTSTL